MNGKDELNNNGYPQPNYPAQGFNGPYGGPNNPPQNNYPAQSSYPNTQTPYSGSQNYTNGPTPPGASTDFNQSFMNDVRTSAQGAVAAAAEQQAKKKKIIIIVIIALVTVLALAFAMIALVVMRNNPRSATNDTTAAEEIEDNTFSAADTSMIDITVAPSTADIIINGQKYDNGEHEIAPGEYEVKITAAGFQPYEGRILVGEKRKTYVAVCLTADDPNYYDNHSDEGGTCNAAEELRDVAAWEQAPLIDEIFNYAPIHKHDEGFFIDPYVDKSGKVIVDLTFKDCDASEDTLTAKAYAWMRAQGLNPNKYTYEKTWDCE
ncbi:hypothetical protein IKE72_01535 [Candidatus Saccharibacteria bacterium]|nr:hypothetical protein [Candidatus Saccharibacteria bacterium]